MVRIPMDHYLERKVINDLLTTERQVDLVKMNSLRIPPTVKEKDKGV